jgi:peptide/nickel transport system permease protein
MAKESLHPVLKFNRQMMKFSTWFSLAFFLSLAIFPWDHFYPAKISLSSIASPISWDHLLGADNLGRDLLTRLAGAVQGAVLPLWVSVSVFTVLGISLGFLALVIAQKNKFLSQLISLSQIVAAVFASLPVSVAIFFLVVKFDAVGLWPVLIVLGALFALRSYLQMFNLFEEDHRLAYWQAHHAMGGSIAGRIFRYGLMNRWGGNLFSSYCFHLQIAVAIEASLSYLGFGVQEPQASFGNMLASHFDMYLKGHWQIVAIIVFVMFVVTQAPIVLFEIVKKNKL